MAPARHVLAIDQGTSSSARSCSIARARRSRRAARARAALSARRLGRARSGGDLAGHGRGLSRGAGQGRAAAAQIAALGITNQRETVVLWERASGRPVHRALVWQDRRTAELCRALSAAGHDALVGRAPAF